MIKFMCCMLVSLSCILTSCVGLHRDSFDKWERKSFPKLGFSVELPKDCMIQANTVRDFNFNKSLCVRIHNYTSAILAESTTVISIEMVVANKTDIKKYMQKKLSFFDKGIGTVHSSLSEYDTNTTVPVFRRDYSTKDGGAILCGAYFHKTAVKNQDNKEKDIQAIKRILNSVKITRH